MSKAVSHVFKAIGSVVSAIVGGLTGQGAQKPQTPSAPPAPPAPPRMQQAVSPTGGSLQRKPQQAATGGYGGSNASTFLTGAEGVKPSELSLGRNELLGG